MQAALIKNKECTTPQHQHIDYTLVFIQVFSKINPLFNIIFWKNAEDCTAKLQNPHKKV